MIEVAILVPLKNNDGMVFDPEWHLAFEAHVLSKFGGISLLPGTVSGKWVDSGNVYTDDLRTYVVAMSSITEGAALREILDFAAEHYQQFSLYVRYLGASEVYYPTKALRKAG
jgi:hypothetical protein